jgi:hypothetical protein
MENIEFFLKNVDSLWAYSPVAQLVEQTVVSRPVDGSSPFPGSQIKSARAVRPYFTSGEIPQPQSDSCRSGRFELASIRHGRTNRGSLSSLPFRSRAAVLTRSANSWFCVGAVDMLRSSVEVSVCKLLRVGPQDALSRPHRQGGSARADAGARASDFTSVGAESARNDSQRD